jgi:hypothetical protein
MQGVQLGGNDIDRQAIANQNHSLTITLSGKDVDDLKDGADLRVIDFYR